MADIVLVAVNANYIHPPFGLYCLRAALGPLRDRCRILDFTMKVPVTEVEEALIAESPAVVGFGVYLWNRSTMLELARRLRQRLPGTLLVAGGPEVSGAPADDELRQAFDKTIDGAGELPFRQICEEALGTAKGGLQSSPTPYLEYSEHDLQHRLTYVESSRGCAFRCSFCTSATHPGVEDLPLEAFLDDLGRLITRGARRIKFLDRSFNLDIGRACAILDFLLDHPGYDFVHFELVPDRMPEELRQRLRAFPSGRLRLEVGVQTLDTEVSAAIDRPLRRALVLENLRFLAQETSAIVHVDLIAGLPGERLEGFARGVDTLWSILGHRSGTEVQLGILKRLPGTPLDRNPPPKARFRAEAPYDLLESAELDASTLALLNHTARLWERVVNRGRFPQEVARLLGPAEGAFLRFLTFSQWFVDRHGRSWGIALEDLGRGLNDYLGFRSGDTSGTAPRN